VKNDFFVIIYGPTGVGKSDFALKLASNVPSEIVNIDLGQLYIPLTIGTAKPNLTKTDIPHNLFDILSDPIDFSVVEYRKILKEKLQEIWGKKKIPILVGGSSFYVKSLFFPPLKIEENYPKKIDYDKEQDLWDVLYKIDPKRASKIEKTDLYRIKRALAIWEKSGKLPSEFMPEYEPIAKDFLILHLTRDRNNLYERINKRTIEMLRDGWIEEVENILNTNWVDFLRNKKLIGYVDILDFLDNKITKKEMIENIQKKTRNYAKKQETFWRMLEKKLQEVGIGKELKTINLTSDNVNLYIKQLSGILKNKIK
jgi:tRNA dimethylallyltransferase